MAARSERQIKKDKFCSEFFSKHKHEYTRVNDKGKTVCDTRAAMKAMNEQWIKENGISKRTSKKKPSTNRMVDKIEEVNKIMEELKIVKPEISKEEVQKNLNTIASGIDPNTTVKLLPRPPLRKRK